MDALCKGLLTVLVVWLLLLAARRLGGRFAGLLTGLPTVSGPALLWMAWDHGPSYASSGAAGAVVGAIGCAAFARSYIWAGRSTGVLTASIWAVAAGAAGLALGRLWSPSLLWAVPAALLVVLLLQVRKGSGDGETRCSASASPLFTALVAGGITTVVTLGLGSLDAHGAGVVTSLPVIAAVVSARQHRTSSAAAAHRFLDGYLAGLVGRVVFSGSFGFLVLAMSWHLALGAALLLAAAVQVVGAGARRALATRSPADARRSSQAVRWFAKGRTALCAVALTTTLPTPLSLSHAGAEQPLGRAVVLRDAAPNDRALADHMRQFALNALLVPLIDANDHPPRWRDLELTMPCLMPSGVRVNGAEVVPGEEVPGSSFSVQWKLDHCLPFGPEGPELVGVAEVNVFADDQGLSARVVLIDFQIDKDGRTARMNEVFTAMTP